MLETPPTWAIALVFWLHMLATVAWLGGLAAIAILVLPAAKQVLKPIDQLAFIEAIQKRLEPLAWFSLAILIATGLFQLSVNPHYDGFLSTSGQWSLAILTKHTLVALLNEKNAVNAIFDKYPDDIAAVIIEPIPANNGLLLQTKEYLQFLRDISAEHNALLIFYFCIRDI